MSIFKLPMLYKGSKGQADLVSLFDTDASFSYVSPDVAQRLANLKPLPEVMYIPTARDGHELRVEYTVRLEFYLNGVRLSDEFIVIPDLPYEAVIGATTIQKWHINLDFEHNNIWVDPAIAIAMLK